MKFIKTAIKEQQVQNKEILHMYFSWNNCFSIMPVSCSVKKGIIATPKHKKVVLQN